MFMSRGGARSQGVCEVIAGAIGFIRFVCVGCLVFSGERVYSFQNACICAQRVSEKEEIFSCGVRSIA